MYGSYGAYIWAAPLQQMFIALGVTNGWVLLTVSVPAAYLVGLASWHFVEMPTQKLRRYLNARQLPMTSPAPEQVPGPVPHEPSPTLTTETVTNTVTTVTNGDQPVALSTTNPGVAGGHPGVLVRPCQFCGTAKGRAATAEAVAARCGPCGVRS